MLHFSAGCILSDDQWNIQVIGYIGASVLLPCFCADTQSTVKTFTWEIQANENQWINAFTYEKYSDRLELFNESSSTNLSLISGLRQEDEGFYADAGILLTDGGTAENDQTSSQVRSQINEEFKRILCTTVCLESTFMAKLDN